jgi:tetratricopeptide (TPR) repeat protein
MRGRESEANEDFKIAIELEPESAGAWQGLADQSLGRGEIDKAIEQYQVAVKLDPLLKWAWKNLAYAFAKIRQFDNAVNAAKMALKVDPNFPEALSDLERFQRAKETVNTTQTLGGSMPVTK